MAPKTTEDLLNPCHVESPLYWVPNVDKHAIKQAVKMFWLITVFDNNIKICIYPFKPNYGNDFPDQVTQVFVAARLMELNVELEARFSGDRNS